MADTKEILVARRKFKSSKIKSLIEIEGKIQITPYSLEPVAYFAIYDGFERKDEQKNIKMKLEVYELESLARVLLEWPDMLRLRIADGTFSPGESIDSGYSNYSGGKENGKILKVGAVVSGEPKSDYDILTGYLNFEQPSSSKKFGFPMTINEMTAVGEIMSHLSRQLLEQSDSMEYQRRIKELRAEARTKAANRSAQ